MKKLTAIALILILTAMTAIAEAFCTSVEKRGEHPSVRKTGCTKYIPFFIPWETPNALHEILRGTLRSRSPHQ